MCLKLSQLKTAIFLGLSTIVVLPIISNHAAWGQSTTTQREGLPLRRVGGGTRGGGCYYKNQSLTALVPETEIGKTISATPKLFFYVPKNRQPTEVKFMLRDKGDRLIYQTSITNDASGVIAFQVPDTETTQLQVGETYQWEVSMICNPQNPFQDLVVRGWIERVEISSAMAAQLNQADQTEIIALYQNADLWYDALAAAVELRSKYNQNDAPWLKLLSSVGLEKLSQTSIIPSTVKINQSATNIR